MESNNPQKRIAELTVRWESLQEQQAEALASGDLEKLEKLIKTTAEIQTELETLFPGIKRLPPQIIEKLKSIEANQDILIAEMSRGTQTLSDTIGRLRKNRTSMQGYKQSQPGPRFFNKLT